jgi:chromosome segregation ATPase
MIEHIRTIGFKGQDLDEDVPQKALYVGPNRSGKSTRSAAIALALYGNIPFLLTGKKPGDIFKAYASGNSLVVAVTIKGTEFARKISPNGKGGYSLSVQIDKKRQSAENFAVKLNEVGAPRIADIAQFMKDSDAKKIDTLFELFPVEDDLKNIDSEIEKAKDDVSKYKTKKDQSEAVIQRLNASKSQIALPAGNIAETQAEIKKIESQIKDTQEQIKQVEIEWAKVEAKEKGKAEGKKEAEQKALKKMESAKQSKADDSEFYGESQASLNNGQEPEQQQPHFVEKVKDMPSPVESIKRIIGALTASGCETCAALIVAKQELKKYGKL